MASKSFLVHLCDYVLHLGIDEKQNDLIKRRIILTNTLNLTIQAFCIVLMGFTVYYNLLHELVVGAVALMGTILVFWLNYKGRHRAASLVLINTTSTSIFAAAIIAYNFSILAEPENWLFAFITVAVFLFDGLLMVSQFILIFAEILVAKLYKYLLIGDDYGRDFVLLIVNTIVHCLGLYIFLIFIKKDHFKTQYKLEESNRTKKKLLSILAHDIRSPLGNLRALLSLNTQGILNEEDFQKHKEKVNGKMGFLMTEIDDVLEWSVVQSENLDPEVISFNPKKHIEKITEAFSDLCNEKTIDLSLEGELEEVSMDENHFKLIIRNLLHNAIKFTSEKGKIKISLNQIAEQSVVQIKDTGVGMTPEVLEELTSLGKTASLKGTNGEKGTGLGLTMCMDLIQRNGAELDIKSKVREGSTFQLRIPSN